MASHALATALRRLDLFEDSVKEVLSSPLLRVRACTAATATATATSAPNPLPNPLQRMDSADSAVSGSLSSFRSSPSLRNKQKSVRVKDRGDVRPKREPIKVTLKPVTGMSLKEKRRELLQQEADKDGRGQGMGLLDTFKIQHDIRRGVYETLFVRPSPTQEALACAKESRSPLQLELIGVALSHSELFRSFSVQILSEIARHVEYHTILSKGQIISQNKPVSAICVVLSGAIQSKLEVPSESGLQAVVINELRKDDVIGLIDVLFQVPGTFAAEFVQREHWYDDNISQVHSTMDSAAPQADMYNLLSSSQNMLSSDFDFETEGEQKSPLPLDSHLNDSKLTDRAFQPGSFTSYNISEPTELAVIPFTAVRNALVPALRTHLLDTMELLRASGLFWTFSKAELVRLVRSAFTKRFQPGEVMLRQGSKPTCIFIMIKGLGRVLKRPTRTQALQRRLTAVKAAQRTLINKYAFHHMALKKKYQGTESSAEKPLESVTDAEAQQKKIGEYRV